MNALIEMRSSCRECGGELGRIDTRGGQDVVFCAGCGKWAGYNASKAETGREVRSLRTRGRIKPKQRARILERDNATCVLCHRADVELDVGHLISVKEGREQGLSDAELDSDPNLAAMCQPCNSGLGGRSVSLRFAVALLRASVAREAAA